MSCWSRMPFITFRLHGDLVTIAHHSWPAVPSRGDHVALGGKHYTVSCVLWECGDATVDLEPLVPDGGPYR